MMKKQIILQPLEESDAILLARRKKKIHVFYEHDLSGINLKPFRSLQIIETKKESNLSNRKMSLT